MSVTKNYNPYPELNPSYLKTPSSGIPQKITEIIHEIYSDNLGKIQDRDCTTVLGIVGIFLLGDNSQWSKLNYFDNNTRVIEYLRDKFISNTPESNRNLESFKLWLDKYKYKLFSQDSTHFKIMLDKVSDTTKRGIERENDVLKWASKINPSASISTYCYGDINDRFNSIDMKINGVGYQIKPLKWYEKKKDGYHVSTSGMGNFYKDRELLDRIIYANSEKNIYLIFENKDYNVINNGMTVIHNNEPLKPDW